MFKFKILISYLILSFLFINFSVSFGQSKKESKTKNQYGFFAKGTTGKNVMLDVTWYKECIPDGFGGFDKSMRTMSGNELATTVIKYNSADCKSGISMITVFVQTLTNDNVQVPINWVDNAGKPTNAPSGLEKVKTGNGATGIITYATITPITKEQADGLNYIKMGGFTDWSAGVTKDMLPYFSAIGPMKGTVIIDDRTGIGAVYDGISTNPKEYPTSVSNIPHKGKLNGIKY